MLVWQGVHRSGIAMTHGEGLNFCMLLQHFERRSPPDSAVQKVKRSSQINERHRTPLAQLFRPECTLSEVAERVGCSEQMIRQWIKQASRADVRGIGPLDVQERAELQRLRAENGRLRTEREVLLKASARFVRETSDLLTRPSTSLESESQAENDAVSDVAVWVRGLA